MPAAFPVLAAESDIVIDQESRTITMTRHLDAPRTQVFEAWTQAQHIACWWDPAGKRLAECEIDLRPGGAFRFTPEGHPDMPFTGTYQQISPPEKLVFIANGATGTVLLAESAGKTHMTVTIDCGSAELFEAYIKIGVDKGTAMTMDNLVAYVRVK
jgi:uncharacterized protein YndB with AHSA1/START domain